MISVRAARALLRGINPGSLEIREPGRSETFGSGVPHASLEVRDERFWAALLGGSKKLGLAYADGWWDSDDLTTVLRIGALNLGRLEWARRIATTTSRPFGLMADGGASRDRANIASHYDTGNDFFSLFLDETLTYSSGLFEPSAIDLKAAQLAKIDRLCAKLNLGPGDQVLEIGTGWGSFALRAAKTHGCHVTTTTISAEQYAYTKAAVSEVGLDQNVTVIDEHWRDLSGRYDKLISVEMIEAFDWRDLGTYFEKCSSLLRPSGLMALQAITITDQRYDRAKRTNDFIRAQIFPGGCLPSVAAILAATTSETDLSLVDLRDIGPHYATTLRHWRENFASAADEATQLGFGKRDQRMWNFYFAYCEAAFLERQISDVQMLFAKPDWRAGDR
ncbi:MAG: class I SAM-dependent methyltransferase [Acidimicrobiales bacterium]